MSRSRRSRRLCRSTVALVSIATLAGVSLAILLSISGHSHSDFISPLLPIRKPEPLIPSDVGSVPPLPPPPPAVPHSKYHEEHLDLEDLRDLVARTKGYLVRDYSLGLGWNNVRSNISAVRRSLNRILGSVHHRSCYIACSTYESHACIAVFCICTFL